MTTYKEFIKEQQAECGADSDKETLLDAVYILEYVLGKQERGSEKDAAIETALIAIDRIIELFYTEKP